MSNAEQGTTRGFWASFFEKVFLLLLSGILIPIVMMFVNAQIEQRQMRLQTQQIQQESLQAAKRELWENITQTFLAYETLALDVSWFGSKLPDNEGQFRKAYDRYNEETVSLIVEMRVQMAQLKALSSKSAADQLFFFYRDEVLENQDIAIVALEASNAGAVAWDQQHKQNERSLENANLLMTDLAIELGLGAELMSEDDMTSR